MLSRIMRDWYKPKMTWLTSLLWPCSLLFALIVFIRFKLYRWGILSSHRAAVPVIVVGNIVVGGTGKTPFVIWLAAFLKKQGMKPGIVSRGVGGPRQRKPHWVTASDQAHDIGDEAVLLFQRTQCPMVVGVDRVQAVQTLLTMSHCNIVISDDGLQHYRLKRDFEIVMVDGDRQYGNRCLLPAGPLREPVSRLAAAQIVILNGAPQQQAYNMQLVTSGLYSLVNQQQVLTLDEMRGQQIHAVAAIGHPERFFKQLQTAGLQVIPHPFADHYVYHAEDFTFDNQLPIIMTEKDAVKCYTIADHRFWSLRVEAQVSLLVEQTITNWLTEWSYES